MGQHGAVDDTHFAVAVSEDHNCRICVNYHLSAEYPDRYVYGHLALNELARSLQRHVRRGGRFACSG